MGIIGPNGAGKSTLLKIIARVIFPTSGWVRGYGRVIPLLELDAGFQQDLTARENIYLTAALYGIPQKVIKENFGRIIDFAEIGQFIDTPLRHFSAGMYMRLAFSLAINLQPDILLADEVLAVGDRRFQDRCLERVAQAGKDGMTVLFVSHDMETITRLCTRVLYLHKGRIRQIGNPRDVVLSYEQNIGYSQQDDEIHRTTTTQNEYGRFIRVKLLSSERREIGAVRMNEEIFLALELEFVQPPGNIRCAVDVYTDGVMAFRSIQPYAAKIDSSGRFQIAVRIPPYILNERIYTVNASMTFLDHSEVQSLVRYHALSFRVYDLNPFDSARGTFEGAMKGVIAPKLEWQMSTLKKASFSSF